MKVRRVRLGKRYTARRGAPSEDLNATKLAGQ